MFAEMDVVMFGDVTFAWSNVVKFRLQIKILLIYFVLLSILSIMIPLQNNTLPNINNFYINVKY